MHQVHITVTLTLVTGWGSHSYQCHRPICFVK